jgi:tetratricopeptide (TPR) repeat protein
MLSGFFNPPWSKPVDELTEDNKAIVLNMAGFNLRALGRLTEAAQPMQTGLEIRLAQKKWGNAAIIASNLSELYLTIGDVKQALAYAEQSVQLADRSSDWGTQTINRTIIGNALHHAAQLEEAQSAFREAEEMQKKNQPDFPLLYSTRGYQYCDLLLMQGGYAEVQRRGEKMFEWRQPGDSLLDIALDNLSIGRAHLLQSQREPNHPFSEAITYLNRAVDGLRQAGTHHWIPRGLLARAEFYRITGAFDKAQKDLDEAFSIATRGGMGLYLADCHLEYARLCLSLRAQAKQSPTREEIASSHPSTSSGSLLAMTEEQLRDEARKHWEIAKDSINKMGYHRRDKEVEEIELSLRGAAKQRRGNLL